MDARFFGGLDRASGGFDVLAFAAGEGSDARISDLASDLANGVGVALAGNRETGLDDIDAQVRKLVGHAQLFVVMHGAARRLLAVA